MNQICKAHGPRGPNYNKPHVWTEGMYDGKPQDFCRFCGCKRESPKTEEESE